MRSKFYIMQVNIIGVRSVDFKTKDGVAISGQNVWFTEPLQYPARGVSADKVFLSDYKKINPQELPCLAEIHYNHYGKVESIKIL